LGDIVTDAVLLIVVPAVVWTAVVIVVGAMMAHLFGGES
jgi:hypothetical protein